MTDTVPSTDQAPFQFSDSVRLSPSDQSPLFDSTISVPQLPMFQPVSDLHYVLSHYGQCL